MSFTASYEVDNDKRFADAIKRAKLATADLRIPLTSIAKDWFRSNKAIFSLKGPGQYPPLGGFKYAQRVPGQPYTYRQRAEARKRNTFGFDYPLLMATGRLMASVTDPVSPDSINQIINKAMLLVGTKVPYGIYHQSDDPRKKIPLRKFVFIGPESKEFASNTQLSGRAERWLNTINSYILAVLGANIGQKPKP